MQTQEHDEAPDKAPPASTADLHPETPEKAEGPARGAVQRAPSKELSATPERRPPTQAARALRSADVGSAKRARASGNVQRQLGNTWMARKLDEGETVGAEERQAEAAHEGKARTTPVGKEAEITRSGAAKLEVAGVVVTVLPDSTSKAKALHGKAETRYQLTWSLPGCTHKAGKVISIEAVSRPSMTIQTTYGIGVSSKSKSAYGKGTTPEDIKAGKTTLGHHEGSHGLDYMRYLRDNPLPRFTGKVGMSTAEFEEARAEYDSAMEAYKQAIHDYSVAQTDCVGIKGGYCKDLESR